MFKTNIVKFENVHIESLLSKIGKTNTMERRTLNTRTEGARCLVSWRHKSDGKQYLNVEGTDIIVDVTDRFVRKSLKIGVRARYRHREIYGCR